MADQSLLLPEPLERILERTLRASALRGHELRRVERELRAYFEDALSAGVSVSEIAAEFGDPELGGTLINRSPPRSASRTGVLRAMQLSAALAAVALVSIYGATAVRFKTFDSEPGSAGPWLDSIANVAALASASRESLRGIRIPGDASERVQVIGVAVNVSRETAALGDPFSRLIAARVARDVVNAAATVMRDPSLNSNHRHALAAHLTTLASTTAQQVQPREILEWFDQLVQRSFDSDGRLTATGLRLVQAMKGAREPSFVARALEPILFVGDDDARAARETARRLFSSDNNQVHHSGLWSTMIVGHVTAGLNAQATVATPLRRLIALASVSERPAPVR